MSIGRTMNEYEGALFGALLVLVKSVPDRGALAKGLREIASDSKADGQENGGAMLNMLARSAESDEGCRPGHPPLRLVPTEDPANSN